MISTSNQKSVYRRLKRLTSWTSNGAEEIKMQKEKVVGVLKWPMPKTVKNVQKFLGLANYYRWFVKDFAKIAKPLHRLVRKNEKWS